MLADGASEPELRLARAGEDLLEMAGADRGPDHRRGCSLDSTAPFV
jgi:hypothetical protein